MHLFLITVLFAGIALLAPLPQLISLQAIDAFPDPVFVAAPLDVLQDTPSGVGKSTVTAVPNAKRRLLMKKRGVDCSPRPAGSGPVPTPDTIDAFYRFPTFQAGTLPSDYQEVPADYTLVFANANASLSASMYMGLYTLTSYHTAECASICDSVSGCQAFNLYIERDPSLDPNADTCPNPSSTTNFRCTLWGTPVSVQEATNIGNSLAQFQVVIAGSNAYNRNTSPDGIPNYDGPTELRGAISVPLDSITRTYMGFKYFPFSQSQSYDSETCANACSFRTTYESQRPALDGSYQKCTFFNVYALSKNGVPFGLYCAFYNETWAPSYATNYGQYADSDRYTVSRSYSYSLSVPSNSTGETLQKGYISARGCSAGEVILSGVSVCV